MNLLNLCSKTRKESCSKFPNREKTRQTIDVSDLGKDFELITRGSWAEGTSNGLDIENAVIDDLSIPADEIKQIYVPLAQKILKRISDHLETTSSIGDSTGTKPFILGVTGGVSVGKSSVAATLGKLLLTQKAELAVEVISTDGFLYPNQRLLESGIMHRKGFPESFDYPAIVTFLSSVKYSTGKQLAPTYSHTTYDVTDTKKIIDTPDVLILEGLNLLQNDPESPNNHSPVIRDFIDLCLFLEAESKDMKEWYVTRFLGLCSEAKMNADSFFNRYADYSEEDLTKEAEMIWDLINFPNLKDNIIPLKHRADWILFKGQTHSIWQLAFRKDQPD